MNLYELNALIIRLEELQDWVLVSFYMRKREELKKDIQKEIRQILDL